MRVKNNMNKILVFLLVLLVGVVVGGLTIAWGSGATLRFPSVGGPFFAKNAAGETYGTLLNVTVPGTEPDLVKALGVDGITMGYVRWSDLNGPEPKTLAEAANQSKYAATKRIPLYESDGKTIIGEFEMGPGDSEITTIEGARIKQ